MSRLVGTHNSLFSIFRAFPFMMPHHLQPIAVRLACLMFLVLTASQPIAAKPTLPDWAARATSLPSSEFGKDADAIKMLDEMELEYKRDGDSVITARQVFRIQKSAGGDSAIAAATYVKGADKVRMLQAWLVLPDGEIREYKEKDFADIESSDELTLYSEMHVRVLDLSNAALPGSTFAWTYTVASKSRNASMAWVVRGEEPVIESRLTIRVPEGWHVPSVRINNPEVDESFDGRTYTCRSKMQPEIKVEASSPRGETTPYLALRVLASHEDKARSQLISFENWNEVAVFVAVLNDPQAQPDSSIRAKVAELCAQCSDTWEKIRAICRYVQNVNYASFSKNIAEGGGLKPHEASFVFSRNYGDCKDKTALLRAMLSCIGVESRAVICMQDTHRVVVRNYPSVNVFNHCITGIIAPEGVDCPALVEHPDLGKLIIFDPTNEHTPLGFTDRILDNTYYLVLDKACMGLSAFPDTGDMNECVFNCMLKSDGSLQVQIIDTSEGQLAIQERADLFRRKRSDYERSLLYYLQSGSNPITINEWKCEDDWDENRFRLEVDYEAKDYARQCGQNLLMVKAFPVSPFGFMPEDAGPEGRASPYIIKESRFVRDTTLVLPDDVEVDSLPKEIHMKKSFGTVDLVSKSEGKQIRVTLTVTTLSASVAPEDYDEVIQFYKRRMKASKATILLRKSE